MAFRTWAKLLGATLGVAALAGASQLGVAYGLGILRLTRVLDVTVRDQWTAQLAWVAWIAMISAVIGGLAGGALLERWRGAITAGTHIGLSFAAGVGASLVVPLTMQPARTAQIAGVRPVFVIGLCAGLGALIGVGAAYAALSQQFARRSLGIVGLAVWVIALVSVLPSLAPSDPLPSVRLGVFDAGFLSPAVTQRTALFTMPALALLVGALLGWSARRRELPTLTIALAGLPGPTLLTLAYLIAGPGSGSERYQVVPYWAAMTATGAGVLGSVLAAVIRRGADQDPEGTGDEPTQDGPDSIDDDQAAHSQPLAPGSHIPGQRLSPTDTEDAYPTAEWPATTPTAIPANASATPTPPPSNRAPTTPDHLNAPDRPTPATQPGSLDYPTQPGQPGSPDRPTPLGSLDRNTLPGQPGSLDRSTQPGRPGSSARPIPPGQPGSLDRPASTPEWPTRADSAGPATGPDWSSASPATPGQTPSGTPTSGWGGSPTSGWSGSRTSGWSASPAGADTEESRSGSASVAAALPDTDQPTSGSSRNSGRRFGRWSRSADKTPDPSPDPSQGQASDRRPGGRNEGRPADRTGAWADSRPDEHTAGRPGERTGNRADDWSDSRPDDRLGARSPGPAPDDRPARHSGSVALGDDTDPPPFDAFAAADRRSRSATPEPFTPTQPLTHTEPLTHTGPLTSPEPKPYVPAPAIPPLPPGAIQDPPAQEAPSRAGGTEEAPSRAGGLLGRARNPFARRKSAGRPTDQTSADDTEPTWPGRTELGRTEPVRDNAIEASPSRNATQPWPDDAPAPGHHSHPDLAPTARQPRQDAPQSARQPWPDVPPAHQAAPDLPPARTPLPPLGDDPRPSARDQRQPSRDQLPPARDPLPPLGRDAYPAAAKATAGSETTPAGPEPSGDPLLGVPPHARGQFRDDRPPVRSPLLPTDRPASRAPLVPEPHAVSSPLPQPDPITPPLTVTPAPEPEPVDRKGRKKRKDDDYVDWVSGLGGE